MHLFSQFARFCVGDFEMKFQEMGSAGGVPVDSYDDGGVEIAQVRHAFPLLLADKAVASDKASWQDFSADDVQAAFDAGAEMILLGTGKRQHFAAAELRVRAAELGIGLECMTTAAACRTYILLQSEGRQVWAWLWA